jgi:hypothetical protein
VLEARSAVTSTDRLRELAADDVRPVRLWTARNENTPADALDRLTQDEDPWVRWNALLHRKTPGSALERLAEIEAAEWGNDWFLARGVIVHHPNTPSALRRQLLDAGACRNCPDHPCASLRIYQ